MINNWEPSTTAIADTISHAQQHTRGRLGRVLSLRNRYGRNRQKIEMAVLWGGAKAEE